MIYVRPAAAEELPAAYEFVDAILGPGITPYPEVEKMQRHNPRFINIVTTAPRVARLEDIFGYFSLVPLTAGAHQLVHDNQLHGADMRPEHMPAQGEPVSALYLGAVAATDRNMLVLRSMFKAMAEYEVPHYTRPISAIGFSIFERVGYVPVADHAAPNGKLNYIKTSDHRLG